MVGVSTMAGPMKIRIEGLTTRQTEMLDMLWSMDTTDEVIEWLATLSESEFKMAVTLQEMIIGSLMEQKAEEDVSLAQTMLRNIGIKC